MAIIGKRRLLDQVELTDHEKKNLLILDTIRKKGPIPRAEIARLIGLNIVTVTSYVDQYIKKGVLVEVGMDVSSGGRKPSLVDLNPPFMFFIGLGLSLSTMTAVLTNLKGEILFSVKKERPLVSADQLVQKMADVIAELVEVSNVDMSKVYGIGIGMPGPFDKDASSIRWEAGLVDKDLIINIPMHSIFEKKFGVPIFIDHDANAAMFGENWYAQNLGLKHAIYLYSGDGYGFMFQGEIYRGANGCAGEWLFGLADEPLEASVMEIAKKYPWYSLDLGISIRAMAQKTANPNSKIFSLANNDVNLINLQIVSQAAEDGDELARTLLIEGGQRLGRKAAFLVNLLNPEILIIGGGVEIGGAILLDSIRNTIKKLSHPEATEKLRIIASTLGENAVALGAAALVEQNYFVTV